MSPLSICLVPAIIGSALARQFASPISAPYQPLNALNTRPSTNKIQPETQPSNVVEASANGKATLSSAVDFPNRMRQAAEILEAIAKDRALLAQVATPHRERLLKAAGQVSRPDAPARRRFLKAQQRKRKTERLERDERDERSERLNTAASSAMAGDPSHTRRGAFRSRARGPRHRRRCNRGGRWE